MVMLKYTIKNEDADCILVLFNLSINIVENIIDNKKSLV